MPRLNIYNRRERVLVRALDAVLLPFGAVRRTFARPVPRPRRILCLRLERIGDLLMTLPALAHLRRSAPGAEIDLVVGSWNAEMAAALPEVDRVETLDASWLSRSENGSALLHLLRRARGWKRRRYDLAINFEPDVRTNILLAASAARTLAGFASGGGGPLLDVAIPFDTRAHTSDNAVRLVSAALGIVETPSPPARLNVPEPARADAARLIGNRGNGPLIAFHISAGRAVKQWPEARFRELALTLIRERNAWLIFTGSPGDRDQIDLVAEGLPADRVVDVSGRADLLTLAGVLERVNVLVTVDTGPMHVAQAVGTPVIAVFGPSDPVRYAPRGALDRVVRIDLPCAPCNRIRLPPARCTGHTPDCLSGIHTAQVFAAVDEVLRASTADLRNVRRSSG